MVGGVTTSVALPHECGFKIPSFLYNFSFFPPPQREKLISQPAASHSASPSACAVCPLYAAYSCAMAGSYVFKPLLEVFFTHIMYLCTEYSYGYMYGILTHSDLTRFIHAESLIMNSACAESWVQ